MMKLRRLLNEARSEIVGGLVVAGVLALLALLARLYASIGLLPVILIVLVGLWLTSAYLAFRLRHPREYDKKNPPKWRLFWPYSRWYAISGNRPWQYGHWRPLALACLVVIPVLLLGAAYFEYRFYEQARYAPSIAASGEFHHLNDRGLNAINLGQYREALNYFQQAQLIAREAGDRSSEGHMFNNMGNVYMSA
jgi:tetratricopeptide (TPR) repeat protein